MDWSNEETLLFLEVYRSEQIIWDPKHIHHKDKQKNHDAWRRISQILNKSVVDLKTKKNSLMATFRSHLRRRKASIKSGAALEDIYKPIWFAFEPMAAFLSSIYECDITTNTEHEDAQSPPQVSQDRMLPPESPNMEEGNLQEPARTPCNPRNSTQHQKRRRQQDSELDIAHKNINETVTTLKNAIMNKNKSEEDECQLYGKLLATKLRNYSAQQRYQMMYQIDGLLLANPPQELQDTTPRFSLPVHGSSIITRSPSPSSNSTFCPRSQSPIYINRWPSASNSPVYNSPLNIPSSSNSTPVLIHILERSADNMDTYLPSESSPQILSNEIITPNESQSIIEMAYETALNNNN